jgi:VWFA-related protein
MKRMVALMALLAVALSGVAAQTPSSPQKPQQEIAPEDIVRITTSLVQTDVVVTDKNDQAIHDLKLEDFKVYENGKPQNLKFIESVSTETGARIEGSLKVNGQVVEPGVSRNLSAGDLHRVFAFVIDDLTIPFEDVITVRNLLTDFIDKQMRAGDLIAIVRVAGGRGLLQQFTSDRQLLRRAIAEIRPTLNAYSAFNNITANEAINTQPSRAAVGDNGIAMPQIASVPDVDVSDQGITSGQRAMITLHTSGEVVNSMKTLPGRKNLVLISGGLPLYEASPSEASVNGVPTPIAEVNSYLNNVSYLLRQLTDRASRAGVVINTFDFRGLKASRGVSLFTDPGNEGRSALFGGGGSDTNFGRSPNMAQFDNKALDTLSGHLGLQALASGTGGLSVVNTNDFGEALQRILSRSDYYLIGYRPVEPFDGKFRKLEIKIDRPGAKVYTRAGYVATTDPPEGEVKTKEEAMLAAVRSPLAKRDIDVSGALQYRFLPDNRADVDINLFIDAHNLTFKRDANDKYQATFEVAGFLANSAGKSQGGFSQTVNVSFSPEELKRAMSYGISYMGHATLLPGEYQLSAIVREDETGRLGSMSQFLEVPDLSRKRLTASSLFLYSVDQAQGNKAKPQALSGLRQLSRSQDLRYAAVIYNAKSVSGGPQLQAHIVLSRSGNVLFQEPDQPVTTVLQNGQVAKIGQFGLSRVPAGRLMLTLVVTDPQAGKQARTIARSVEFLLVD